MLLLQDTVLSLQRKGRQSFAAEFVATKILRKCVASLLDKDQLKLFAESEISTSLVTSLIHAYQKFVEKENGVEGEIIN